MIQGYMNDRLATRASKELQYEERLYPETLHYLRRKHYQARWLEKEIQRDLTWKYNTD